MSVDDFLPAFTKYIADWQALEIAYYQIPSWRWFKQLKNIRERESLTRLYVARMKHWGIIE
jgi:hypothetical protein